MVDYVDSVAITVDNKYIVIASAHFLISIFNLDTGTLVRTIKNHSDEISQLAIYNDHKYIIGVSRFSDIIISDFATGTIIKKINYNANTVAITNDNKYFVTGSNDRTIKIWELDTLIAKSTNSKPNIITLTGNLFGINHVILSKDNKYIISGSHNHEIKIWHYDTRKYISTVPEYKNESVICSLAMTTDNKYIVCCYGNHYIAIFEMETGQWIFSISEDYNWMSILRITNDNKYVVFGSATDIKFIELDTGVVCTQKIKGDEWVRFVLVSHQIPYPE